MNNLLIVNMYDDLEKGKVDKIIFESPLFHNMMKQLDQGKLWLKENNLEAFKVLFGEPEEFNNNPWTTNLEGTDQSLQDFVVAHFEENPIKISYFIWMKEDEKDNELRKDGLSVNLENKLTLIYLCSSIIKPKSGNIEDVDKKQSDYFMNLVNIYTPDDKFNKQKLVFNDKLEKDEGNQYIDRIINNLSGYNKLVFLYTMYDLLYINSYLNDDRTIILDEENIRENMDAVFYISELLVNEGLFKDLKVCSGIMMARTLFKLEQVDMIESFGSDLDERGKDVVIYLLLNFIFRKKDQKKAYAEFNHIVSLLNYDIERIRFNDDGNLSDNFMSEDDAIHWLLNIDEDSKEMFQLLVKIIISSNLHYSVREQLYLNNLIDKAKLSGMHGEEKINDWLVSFCDTDKEEVIDKITELAQKEAEKKFKLRKKIEAEKDLKKQEKLIKSAINKYPEEWRWQNLHSYNLYDQKKFTEGIKIIQMVVDKNPEEPMYYDTCAMGYYYLGDYNKALELMTKGIKLDPKGEKCYINEHYYNRGNVLIKMDNIKDAKKDFKAALDFNNQYFKKYGTPSLKKAMKKMVADALEKL
tara:strand:+ start:14 stop:1756 length:1743 start_codon:yes stop_codon:yes gene_type:complete